jgi:hypothetical protein
MPEKLQMVTAFTRLREGKWDIRKHWHKIIEEVNNYDVQRENVINWINNLMTEMCVIEEGSVSCHVDSGMNLEQMLIFYVT